MAPTVYPGLYDRPPEVAVRSSTWLRVVAMLLAALLVVLGMQWWAGNRDAALLGPDGSGVVVSMSGAELPTPQVINSDHPTPGFEEAAAQLGTAHVLEATSTSYAFLDTQETAKGRTVPVA